MEESTEFPLPKIKIIGMKKKSDGNLDVDFEVSDDFLELVKLDKNKEEISKEELGDYVRDILSKASSEQDGWSIKKEFKENTKTDIDK
tara:strand:+ start:301 stop:564 length:264 start_codon:yes stop_codon:yes gene_type:complete